MPCTHIKTNKIIIEKNNTDSWSEEEKNTLSYQSEQIAIQGIFKPAALIWITRGRFPGNQTPYRSEYRSFVSWN